MKGLRPHALSGGLRILLSVFVTAVLSQNQPADEGPPQETNATSDEPQVPAGEDEPVWAGRWETDMGPLLLEHMGREVYGKLEQNTGSLSGLTTTDRNIVIGQLSMTTFKGGFRLQLLENAQEFAGMWWREGSKDRLPWSGKRTLIANVTRDFFGDVNVGGNLDVNAIHASGTMAASGLVSSTITQASSQQGNPYLLSGVNCHWEQTTFRNCGLENSGQSWGGLANVQNSEAEGSKLTVFFQTLYTGNPFCFVSFGGAETTNHYSLDAFTDRVDIFLKKKGCCSMDWRNFNGQVVLICHGAAASLAPVV